MSRTVQMYQTNNGPCPYLPQGIWENVSFFVEYLPDEVYESLLNQGFRRSGCSIYHPICKNCQACVPLRVSVAEFQPNKGQRRTWRKNQDLWVEPHPLEFTPEAFELYQRYQIVWHGNRGAPTPRDFEEFLLRSPVTTEMLYYYLGTQLIAVGWVDRLPSLLSSVYFIFDPALAERRLGVYSILYEIEYCRQRGLSWLYLGYWVNGSAKMDYKAEYGPAQILRHQQWQAFTRLPEIASESVGEGSWL